MITNLPPEIADKDILELVQLYRVAKKNGSGSTEDFRLLIIEKYKAWTEEKKWHLWHSGGMLDDSSQALKQIIREDSKT